MPNRSRTKKPTAKSHRPANVDPNVAAFNAVQQIIASGEAGGKNPLAVALGRLGGLKGGRARAEKLTAEQRRESARHAATVRHERAKQAK